MHLLLSYSLWTYTIITLRVSQWEIFGKKFTSGAHSGQTDAAAHI